MYCTWYSVDAHMLYHRFTKTSLCLVCALVHPLISICVCLWCAGRQSADCVSGHQPRPPWKIWRWGIRTYANAINTDTIRVIVVSCLTAGMQGTVCHSGSNPPAVFWVENHPRCFHRQHESDRRLLLTGYNLDTLIQISTVGHSNWWMHLLKHTVYLCLSSLFSPQRIAHHPIQAISFASGGDPVRSRS